MKVIIPFRSTPSSWQWRIDSDIMYVTIGEMAMLRLKEKAIIH